jgi:hypothetical protein
VGIPKCITVTISGLVFTGVAALSMATTTPVAAATLTAPASSQVVNALPTWDDDGDDDDWDDDWDDDDDGGDDGAWDDGDGDDDWC